MDRPPVRCRFLVSAEPLLAIFAILALAGCTATLPFVQNDFGPALAENANVEQVVRRVNSNIQVVQAWRSDDVRISGAGMPLALSGRITVERPRNFRLIATAMGMDEADFGSNRDTFWFWIKRNQSPGHPSYVYQAKHEDIEQSDALRRIPFQPDWLMEALMVVPIDAQQVTRHPGESPHTVNLVSERLSPSGQPVKKVIRVDMRRGVILGQNLYDASGKLIAKAAYDKYARDRHKQVIMPHLFVFEWPQAGMQISLEIGAIEINPASISARIWEVPNKQPLYPPFDIGAHTRHRIQHVSAGDRRDFEQAASAAPRRPLGKETSSRSDLDFNVSGRSSDRLATGRPSGDSTSNADWETPVQSSGQPAEGALSRPVATAPIDPSEFSGGARRATGPSRPSPRDPFSTEADKPEMQSEDAPSWPGEPITSPPR